MNLALISGMTAALSFGAIGLFIVKQLKARHPINRSFYLWCLVPLLAQGFLLYRLIDASDGQNLSIFNMLSMTTWLAMMVIIYHALRRESPLIVALMAFVCAIASVLPFVTESQDIWYLKSQWASLTHIFSAIAATGFMLLATIQASMLAYADHSLRKHPTQIPAYFPPIQSLESLLFKLLVVGFVLMSVSLLTAFTFLADEMASQPLHKRLLSIMAWLTFAGLLLGHKIRGWRGVVAAKWTISGFILLCLGYFGSKLVLELILSPA
ncbi:inner membrane protein YpjD [Pleionea sp. CnH1-48]|uniref:cytochrome C assembly family protein n=1 Tax=Pleionea sp. CnH1-48 TaxID=2954494 RepID=UPI002096BA73|nr:cytochrome c biogenesis protein CcsA [Pleionea sp. CnH1-48]MCO7225524.1 cytochrome c biogenesis protein CcsA [Pleionea sp. CnH1-48]